MTVRMAGDVNLCLPIWGTISTIFSFDMERYFFLTFLLHVGDSNLGSHIWHPSPLLQSFILSVEQDLVKFRWVIFFTPALSECTIRCVLAYPSSGWCTSLVTSDGWKGFLFKGSCHQRLLVSINYLGLRNVCTNRPSQGFVGYCLLISQGS